MVTTAVFFFFLLFSGSCPTQRLIVGVMAARDPSGHDGSLGYHSAEDLRSALTRVLDIISPAGDDDDPPSLPPSLSGIQPLERQTIRSTGSTQPPSLSQRGRSVNPPGRDLKDAVSQALQLLPASLGESATVSRGPSQRAAPSDNAGPSGSSLPTSHEGKKYSCMCSMHFWLSHMPR